MIKRNEAAKLAGEMGIEYNPTQQATGPTKYRSSAGADKAVPQGSKMDQNMTTIQDAEANVSISGVEQRHMLMQRLSRAPQTRVMCLRNMIQAHEIDGEVEAEVTEECENYGTVRKVVIYQERQSAAADSEVIVKIFVEFNMPQDVQVGSKGLGGKNALRLKLKLRRRYRQSMGDILMEIEYQQQYTIRLLLILKTILDDVII